MYGNKNTPAVRGLTHVARNTAQGIALGFLDCAESFGDWWRLRPWSRQYIGEQPVIQKVFFRMLGKPLDEPLSQHGTPWDDYLVFGGRTYVDTTESRREYVEMVKVALGEDLS